MQQQGVLYLIPVPIAEDALQTLPPQIKEVVMEVKHYFVENLRSARRFLKSVERSIDIGSLSFSEIDKHNGPDTATLRNWLKQGHKVGVVSEAGCPGIADPGAALVAIAHEAGAKVVPITGPSSIILALMASGFNGQAFAFNGYLPVKDPQRSQMIKHLETTSAKEKSAQIFIETPYRNNNIVADLLKNCRDNTMLCIALNITDKEEFIKTLSIKDWKKAPPSLPKAPAVFIIQAQ